MLTISQVKIGQYQQKQIPAQNPKSELPAQKTAAGNFCYPAVYFLGKFSRTERPPFKDSTVKTLDSVCENYQSKLNEISKEEIESTINEIAETTEFSKEEAADAMQLVTQFGNYRSIHKIGEVLKTNEAGRILHNGGIVQFFIYDKSFKDAFKDNFGLNSAMNYLLNQKKLYDINEPYYFAIFLDDNKLKDLEKLKENSPDKIEDLKNWKMAKFFVISGFENGISFIDRSKSLKDTTIDLLNKSKENNMPVSKAVDKEILDRCEKLGIQPIIIKNENKPTAENIYNQLRPEQISRDELNIILDATVMKKFKNIDDQIEAKDGLAKYLENSLENYSPERISKDLKEVHSKIIETAKSLGKKPEDIIYIIPNDSKSYDLIDYQYQKINNIPKEKFITLKNPHFTNALHFQNKVLVVLDDCSLSGSSFLEDQNFEYSINSINAKQNNNNIVFAALYISDYAEDKITKKIYKRKRQNQDIIIKNNSNENNWSNNLEKKSKKSLEEALGKAGWQESRYCLIFPYMAPDNNSEFAANIALFHNLNYRKNNNRLDSTLFALSNIKTLYKSPKEIAELTEELLADND